MLPDDVLLEIFHFFVDEAWSESGYESDAMEAWQSLVHMCRRWRIVVFGSPRRLNLRLVCTRKTRATDTVDIWPALPLLIQDSGPSESMDNIIALLERSDLVHRITQISLDVSGPELEHISEGMQIPFSELIYLDLYDYRQEMLILPLSDSFLGGSTPRLKSLHFYRISYPGLPKLLLSATHLTRLDLRDIPNSGYIPPEAMAACLSTLTSLERLILVFRFPRPFHGQESQRLRPSLRTSLHVLDNFRFRGSGEYLEVLVARIDAPRLRNLSITFFNDIVFLTPQFTRFIGHAPMLEAFDSARVTLTKSAAGVELSSACAELNVRLYVSIYCRELDWQLSFLEQVCTSSLPPLSTLQDLYMMSDPWPQDWKDSIDYAQWLELLHSFPAVKNLYLSRELAPCVVPALQEFAGGGTTKAFPNLENIFLESPQESGPVQEGIEKIVAARQVTSHSITVYRQGRYSNQL